MVPGDKCQFNAVGFTHLLDPQDLSGSDDTEAGVVDLGDVAVDDQPVRPGPQRPKCLG